MHSMHFLIDERSGEFLLMGMQPNFVRIFEKNLFLKSSFFDKYFGSVLNTYARSKGSSSEI